MVTELLIYVQIFSTNFLNLKESQISDLFVHCIRAVIRIFYLNISNNMHFKTTLIITLKNVTNVTKCQVIRNNELLCPVFGHSEVLHLNLSTCHAITNTSIPKKEKKCNPLISSKRKSKQR